jgi:hypothetical protein
MAAAAAQLAMTSLAGFSALQMGKQDSRPTRPMARQAALHPELVAAQVVQAALLRTVRRAPPQEGVEAAALMDSLEPRARRARLF